MAYTLATARAAVRQRLRLSANDPMFSDVTVNRALNIAYSNLLSVQPDGWWFQHVEETVQNGAADAPTFQVRLATPDNTRLIRKVLWVFVSLDGNYFLPIQRRERQDAIRIAGGRRAADGLPLAWSAVNLPQTVSGVKSSIAIAFEPPLPANAYVRYQVSASNFDLSADANTFPFLPPNCVEAVIEGAVANLARQKRVGTQALSRRRYASQLSMAKDAAEAWIRALRIYYNSPAAGPAYSTVRGLP